MCPKKMFVIYVLISVETMADSGKENRRKPREGRFFSFNTLDEDITVDLDFSIPFLSIPVKRTADSTFGALGLPFININPASLALGSAVVLGSTILIPLLLKRYTENYGHQRYSRILDNTEFGAEAAINFARQMLADNRSLRGCTLRIACWAAQNNSADIVKVQQIMSNKLLSTMINSTAVEDAMLSGRYGRECTSYTPCPLNEQHSTMIISNLFALKS